jgi:putative IMPACT (imprinted ancient) family translation regulator
MLTWNEKEIKTWSDFITAIASCKTSDEAKKIMEEYRKDNPEGADINVGYCIGYLDKEERDRLYAIFNVVHPLFKGPI